MATWVLTDSTPFANVAFSAATGMEYITRPGSTIVMEFVRSYSDGCEGIVLSIGAGPDAYAVHRFDGAAGSFMECRAGKYFETRAAAVEDFMQRVATWL